MDELLKRNNLLIEIANEYHRELAKCSYDIGGSAADLVEDALISVLNGYAYNGRIEWLGTTCGYGLKEE